MKNMMNVSVNNTNIMSAPPLKVGELTPPNKTLTPVLFSREQADREFYEIDRYVSQRVKSSLGKDQRKTPTSVYVATGLLTLAGLIFGKQLLKK